MRKTWRGLHQDSTRAGPIVQGSAEVGEAKAYQGLQVRTSWLEMNRTRLHLVRKQSLRRR